MKSNLSIIAVAIFIVSCSSSRDISETYIKNNQQSHEVGKSSSIELYSIFYGFAKNQKKYIELEGYKIGEDKFLVISVDDYLKSDHTNPENLTHEKIRTSIQLTMEEATLFMNSIESLQQSYMKNRPNKNGQYQEDFTITNELYMSFGTFISNGAPNYFLDLWIKGQKYSIKYPKIIKELKRFLENKNW